jgi:hypothetical protein
VKPYSKAMNDLLERHTSINSSASNHHQRSQPFMIPNYTFEVNGNQ